jgi:hypothetical protein
MKFTKLALACSFAFATMAAQAAPGDVGAIAAAAAVPNSNVIFFSGASAPDNFLATVIGGMFQPGFTTVTGTSDATNYRAFVGTAAAGIPGITAGTPLILIKRSQGGSVFGVDPVAKAQLIRTLDVKSASCIEVNATTYTCPIVGTDPVGNTNGTGGAVPDIGVSDVEPALFKLPYNTENGTPQLTTNELSSLVSLPVNQLMMGIVATNAVPATTHLSRSQFGGALAGKIDTWDSIEGTTAGSAMVVCRRVNGSGTQASYNWFFSGFPCNVASSGFLSTPPAGVDQSFGYDGAHAGTTLDPFIVDPTVGLTIVENSGSGDVRNCLASAYYGVDHFVQGDSGKYYRVTFSGVTGTPVGSVASTSTGAPALPTRGGPSKAIGTLSFDSFGNANSAFAYRPPVINGTTGAITTPNTYTFANDPSGLSNSGWSFRQLDGAGVFNGTTQAVTAGPGTGLSPSKTNLVNGKYDFVVELTMQRRTSLSALKTSFFNNLRTRLGATTNTTNVAFATLPDIASWATNPTTVNKFSRGGNTCAPLIAFPPL